MATDSEVSLTSNQRSELSSIAQSRTLPAGYVFRAKLILMLAEGASFEIVIPSQYFPSQVMHQRPSTASICNGECPDLFVKHFLSRLGGLACHSSRQVENAPGKTNRAFGRIGGIRALLDPRERKLQ